MPGVLTHGDLSQMAMSQRLRLSLLLSELEIVKEDSGYGNFS